MVIYLWWTWWNCWWWFRVENIRHEVINNIVIIIHFRIRFVLRRKNISLFFWNFVECPLLSAFGWSGDEFPLESLTVGLSGKISLLGNLGFPDEFSALDFTPLLGFSLLSLFFFEFWLLLTGSDSAFSGPEFSSVFSGSIRDLFLSSPFSRWLFIFGELDGIVGDDFGSKISDTKSSSTTTSS